jgi:hypothetical protein
VLFSLPALKGAGSGRRQLEKISLLIAASKRFIASIQISRLHRRKVQAVEMSLQQSAPIERSGSSPNATQWLAIDITTLNASLIVGPSFSRSAY